MLASPGGVTAAAAGWDESGCGSREGRVEPVIRWKSHYFPTLDTLRGAWCCAVRDFGSKVGPELAGSFLVAWGQPCVPLFSMARNLLVINCDLRETRVALIEDGVIAELQIERASAESTVGSIVLGRVSRVLPGMQAAFIDIGMDRAAFLHVEDLIKPADFEAYLAGGKRPDDEEPSGKGEGGRRHHHVRPDLIDDDDEDDDDDDDDGEGAANGDESLAENDDELEGEEEASAEDASPGPVSAAADLDDEVDVDVDIVGGDEDDDIVGDDVGEDTGIDDDDDEVDDDVEDTGTGDDVVSDDPVADADPSAETALVGAPPDEAWSEDGVAETGAPLAAGSARLVAEDDRARRGRRRRRRRGGKRSDEAPAAREPVVKAAPPEPRSSNGARRGAQRGRGGRGKVPARPSSRVSRSVPITEVVKEGDQVVVQITKEPIGSKGARVSSHVSLPGRYVVYLPTVEHVGISKRIGSSRERQRLRQVIDSLKPEMGGLIIRTVAEGLTKKQVKADVGYLVKLWADIAERRKGAKAPAVLYDELDIVLKAARDLFTDEIERIIIDDRDQYLRLVRFVEMFLPARVKDIELYSGTEPIFDAYGIEDEIGRALSRKVPLASGGYLIIDQAEALAAIDVNTGRFVGKGSKDLEETALKTNLEAVDEIAYQLRFRNIGGLVILDLIDMEIASNRDRVFRALENRLAKDKAKTTINRISELGLIEMTRKRTRESLSRTMHEPCFYCDGTGQIQSRQTIAYEILRQIRRERDSLAGYSVLVNAHPAIVDLLSTEEKDAVTDAERRYMRRIELVPRTEYHIEQFDLQGK